MRVRGAFGTLSRRTLLAVCSAGSVLLHTGVLLANLTPSGPPSGSAHAGIRRTAVVEARLAPALAFEQLPPPAAGPSSASQPAPAPSPASAPGRHARERGHPRSQSTVVAHAADTAEAATGPSEAPYLPRSELSLGPAPQQAIDLAYPDLAPLGRFRAVLTLFIDDQGVVQRVRFDEAGDTGLPPVLEDTARQTFLRSLFTPGEVEGRPVRSQLRIEVEFATETLGEAPAQIPTQTSASTRR